MDLKINQENSVEDSFRSSLNDVITIAERLGPHCKSTQDLVNVVKLALESDSQLSFLFSVMTNPLPAQGHPRR